ncbi:high mobility group protein HMG-I/HMG-Y isoform 5-T6 [Lycaon pictus]
MSESSSKSSQPLASKQEKDGTEKRGRGRPRKQPPNPVKCQHLRDLGADQRGAKTRVLPRPGYHNSREETEGQTQKTGEGGRRGHLAGVLRRGAVTAPCRPLLHRGAVSFWDWTAPLRSHRPCPFPQTHASPPPPCAFTTTLHSTPAAAGPQGLSGEPSPLVLVSSDPSTHTHTCPSRQV